MLFNKIRAIRGVMIGALHFAFRNKGEPLPQNGLIEGFDQLI